MTILLCLCPSFLGCTPRIYYLFALVTLAEDENAAVELTCYWALVDSNHNEPHTEFIMSTEDVENQSNDAGKTVEIEEKGAGDEGLPSSYTHKKNDMVLDADGSTMQEEGGGRILMQ
eukprot:6756097-Ditylum_brightwellii.AAC.1